MNAELDDSTFTPLNTTFVDVTIMGHNMACRTTDWRYLTTPTLSDHPYIYLVLNLSNIQRKYRREYLPKPIEIDMDITKDLIIQSLEQSCLLESPTEIDAAITHLTVVLQSSIKKSTLTTNKTPLIRKRPWWSSNLCAMRYKLRQLQKQTRSSNNQAEAVVEFRSYKSAYQRAIRKAKATEWKRFCKEEFEADPFKAVRKMAGRLQLNGISSLIVNRSTTTDEKAMLESLANTFFPSNELIANPIAQTTMFEASLAVTSRVADAPPPP